MKKLWKIIKENITVVLAMTTAFLSVVYAGIRLMIYGKRQILRLG